MPGCEELVRSLESRLPQDTLLHVCHVSTHPTSCPPLFAPAPDGRDEVTWCESHFLAIAQDQDQDRRDAQTADGPILVLGIEVLIFSTEQLTTVFVSKADSTGFLQRSPKQAVSPSVASLVISTFLQYLISPRLVGPRLVLSLFARSQNQYLFPGSVENSSKHVLDDRQLIKWWCRTLDPIVRTDLTVGSGRGEIKAHLLVPGCERVETRAFFPLSSRGDAPDKVKWVDDFPQKFLINDTTLPPRCLVPRLPDDPKARFLDDLDQTKIDDSGMWRGVKSLNQFWELMSYRQECSAGRLVGFIWVTFKDSTETQHEKNRTSTTDLEQTTKTSADAHNAHQTGTISVLPDTATSGPTETATSAVSLLDANDNEARPKVEGANESVGLRIAAANSDYGEAWRPGPSSTHGQVVLDNIKYSELMDHMLELDFAGEVIAQESTRRWIQKVKDLSQSPNFGVEVKGRSSLVADTPAAKNVTPVANVLTAVRKKRKADVVSGSKALSAQQEQRAPANMFEADLAKKRLKP